MEDSAVLSRSWKKHLKQIIEAAWRRRGLLIAPALLLIPASVALAILLPGGYQAESLVLMKEREPGDALSKVEVLPTSERVQQIALGVQALLLSNHVLEQVADSLDDSRDPQTRTGKIAELRRRLSVSLVGNDFLYFQLRGDQPAGLGRELETVIARLTETLVAQNGLSIGEFILQKRRDELAAAEQRLVELQRQLKNAQPAGAQPLASSDDLDRDVREARRLAEANGKNLEQIRSQLNMDDAELERALEESKRAGHSRGVQLSDYEKLFETQKILGRDLAELEGKRAARLQLSALQQQVSAAEQKVAKQRDAYEVSRRRFGSTATAASTSFMNAPERMVVIDAPRDPVARSKSRLLFVLAGCAGAGLLGVALVLLVEIFDDRIRSIDDVRAATDLPVLAHLPARADRSAIERTIPRLAVVHSSQETASRASDLRKG